MIGSIDQFFHTGNYYGDVLVWVIFTRATFSMAAAILFLIEPMACGGANKLLHRMLALTFFASSLSSFNRFGARIFAVATGAESIPAGSLLITEIFVMSCCVALVAKLGYDYYLYRNYEDLPVRACKFRGEGCNYCR